MAHPGGGGVFSTVHSDIYSHAPLPTLEPRTHAADEVVDDAKVRVLAVGLSPAGGLRTRH